MRKTKDENRRRKQGAYVDFVPDGDPVGVGGLSAAHPRMAISIRSVDAMDERQVRVARRDRHKASDANSFLQRLTRD